MANTKIYAQGEKLEKPILLRQVKSCGCGNSHFAAIPPGAVRAEDLGGWLWDCTSLVKNAKGERCGSTLFALDKRAA